MTTIFKLKHIFVILAVALGATVILGGVLPTKAQGPVSGQTTAFQIKLKSRVFTPSRGLDPALQPSVQGQGDDRIHLMIQLTGIPTDEERAELAAAGIELLSYIPDNTWLASMPANQVKTQTLDTNETIRWMGTIQASDKINPTILADGVGAWATKEDGSVVLDLGFHEDVSAEEARAVVAKHNGVIELDSPDFQRIVALFPTADVVMALAAEDVVVWVDNGPAPLSVRNDGARNNTGVDTIQQQLPDLTGQGVVLGEWDGGPVDDAHPDFAGRLTVAENANPKDSHATHVAGTMAGNGSNSEAQGGTAQQWRGVAPAATIISYDFNGDPPAEHEGAINTYNIDLSQNSWGPTISQNNGNCEQFGDYDLNSISYDRIATGLYTKRMLILFASGNGRADTAASGAGCKPDGVDTNSYYKNIDALAGTKNIISVGATNSNDDTMTEFSDWGPMDDGRIKPDVVAPGCEVGGNEIYSTDVGGGYKSECGTSMATPHVSGIAALLIQQYRTSYQATFLPSSIKATLIHGAKDMVDGNTTFFTAGPDYASGYGRVDAVNAVNIIRDKLLQEGEIANGATNTYTMTVTEANTTLKATLVWDDAAGTAMANPALVNNLDLEVVAPDGVTSHQPWILDPNNPTTAATTGVDNVNNVEQVFVNAPAAGVWTVRVKGTTVPQGPQRYSLVTEPAATSAGSSGGGGGQIYLPVVLKD